MFLFTHDVPTCLQCSMCENGYVGHPTDGSHCYRQQDLNDISDVALPFSQASLLAVGRNIKFSNSDITLTFAVVTGDIGVYVTTNDKAVRLVEKNGQPGLFSVDIQGGVDVLSRVQRDIIVDSSGETAKGNSGIVKRELQFDSLSSRLTNGPVYHYEVDERLTLVIPHDQPDFEQAFHYITVYAQVDSRFMFDYRQTTPRLNLYVFFSLFFSCVVFVSTMLVLSWKLLQFIVEQRIAALDRKMRERRSNRPLYSIIAYLHDGKGPIGGSGVDGVNAVDNADLVYQEVDAKLKSKSVLLLDGKPTYITKKPKGRGGMGGANVSKRKSKAVSLDPSELEVWPVAMQPTADERASVHSLIVQLPSSGKSLRHVVCVGSTLVTFRGPGKEGKSVPQSVEFGFENLCSGEGEPQSGEEELGAAVSGGVTSQSRGVELTMEGCDQVELGPGGRNQDIELVALDGSIERDGTSVGGDGATPTEGIGDERRRIGDVSGGGVLDSGSSAHRDITDDQIEVSQL